jgi:hypothetical protein
LCAYNYNCDTHKHFYKKFHVTSYRAGKLPGPLPTCKRGVSFRRNGVTEKSIISSKRISPRVYHE